MAKDWHKLHNAAFKHSHTTSSSSVNRVNHPSSELRRDSNQGKKMFSSMSNQSNSDASQINSASQSSPFNKISDSSSSSVKSGSATKNTNQAFVSLSSANTTDSNLSNASNAVTNAEQYYQQINSISNKVVKSSSDVLSLSTLIHQLSDQISDSISISSNTSSMNDAAQAIAISIIRINSHKIKALVAKSRVVDIASRAYENYKAYNRAKVTVKKDVANINKNMTNSTDMNAAIATLNSDNARVTSYAHRMNSDVSEANDDVASASTATSGALHNQFDASSAYKNASSVAGNIQHRVIDHIMSGASATSSVANQVNSWSRSANSVNHQIHVIAQQYSDNQTISSANSLVYSNLQTINANNHFISQAASTVITRAAQINYNGQINHDTIDSLGSNIRTISQAASEAMSNRAVVASAMSNASNAAEQANSLADSLSQRQLAFKRGAQGYVPGKRMNHSALADHSERYVGTYKHGYRSANQGFKVHMHTVITKASNDDGHGNLAYRIGYQNAGYFIRGVNDARKRIIKDDSLVDKQHYNVGYDNYRKFIRQQSQLHEKPVHRKNENSQITLSEGLLLVLGFLVGISFRY